MIQHAGQVPAQKTGWRDEPTCSREDGGLNQDGGLVMVRRNHNRLTGIDIPGLRRVDPLRGTENCYDGLLGFVPSAWTLVINHEHWKPILGSGNGSHDYIPGILTGGNSQWLESSQGLGVQGNGHSWTLRSEVINRWTVAQRRLLSVKWGTKKEPVEHWCLRGRRRRNCKANKRKERKEKQASVLSGDQWNVHTKACVCLMFHNLKKLKEYKGGQSLEWGNHKCQVK